MAAGIYLVDNPPRIRQFRSPRRERPSGVVVVHTAESVPDESPPDSGAENVANFIRNRTNYGSYHDLVDSDSIIQLVRYSDEAFHDGTGSNPHSYGVSAATQAHRWNSVGLAWREATVRNMAAATARYARWLKSNYGITIPARRITRAQSEDRVPGFLSHAERDPARRTDPGRDFPWQLYLDTYAGLMAGDQEDDVMTPAQEKRILDAIAGLGGQGRGSVAEDVAKRPNPSNEVALGTMVRRNYERIPAIQAELAALRSAVGEILDRDPSHPLTRADLDAAIEVGMRKVLRVEVSVVDDAGGDDA